MATQPDGFQALLDALAGAWHGLPDKPGETPEGTLEALWRHVGGGAGPGLPALQEQERARLGELVARRIAGEPLSYLTGRAGFMGIELLSGPEAMIPRVETEILARAALGLLLDLETAGAPIPVIDLCTGSGNVGLALAMGDPRCVLFAGDISAQAIRLARRNASHLGLEHRTSFLAGDFLEPFRTARLLGSAGLITCNPPYISTASVRHLPLEIAGFEPEAAFDGGPFGLSLLMRLVKEAREFLRPGGWVACETGMGQGQVVANMFNKSKQYQDVRTFLDPQGKIRVVAAQA